MAKISKRELHKIRRDREQQRALQVSMIFNPQERQEDDKEARLREYR